MSVAIPINCSIYFVWTCIYQHSRCNRSNFSELSKFFFCFTFSFRISCFIVLIEMVQFSVSSFGWGCLCQQMGLWPWYHASGTSTASPLISRSLSILISPSPISGNSYEMLGFHLCSPYQWSLTKFSTSSEVRVEGLETLDYLDNLCQRERFTEQGDAITFESEVRQVIMLNAKRHPSSYM